MVHEVLSGQQVLLQLSGAQPSGLLARQNMISMIQLQMLLTAPMLIAMVDACL